MADDALSESVRYPPGWTAKAARVSPGGEAYWGPQVAIELVEELPDLGRINLGIETFKVDGRWIEHFFPVLDLSRLCETILAGELAAAESVPVLQPNGYPMRKRPQWSSWQEFDQWMDEKLQHWATAVQRSVEESRKFLETTGRDADLVSLAPCSPGKWRSFRERDARTQLGARPNPDA